MGNEIKWTVREVREGQEHVNTAETIVSINKIDEPGVSVPSFSVVPARTVIASLKSDLAAERQDHGLLRIEHEHTKTLLAAAESALSDARAEIDRLRYELQVALDSREALRVQRDELWEDGSGGHLRTNQE